MRTTKRKRNPGPMPPLLGSVPIEALIAGAKSNPAFRIANILVLVGGARANWRNVTAANCCWAVFEGLDLPTPEAGTEDHTTGGVAHGERSGMLNCFGTAREAVSILLDTPHIRQLVKQVYGDDYCIADDRGHYRDKACRADLTDAGIKRLRANTHTDEPGANGTFRDWKCPGRYNECATWRIEFGPSQVAVILLSQSTPHSIGVGGCTSEGGPVRGFYLSPMSPEQHRLYLQATVAQFNKEYTKVTSPRPGTLCSAGGKGEKCVYMWPELVRLGQNCCGKVLVAVNIAFKRRQILYPSKKPVKNPASYSPPYKHYTGYAPAPGSLVVDPADEIARLRRTVPEVVVYFQKIAADLPDWKWACNVSTLGREYLLRVFGLVDDDDAPLSRRYAALRALSRCTHTHL